MKNIIAQSAPASQQKGAVLLVSLIFLVILTLLGISALNTTVLEARLAKNAQERTRAFQATETGLAESAWVFGDNDQLQFINQASAIYQDYALADPNDMTYDADTKQSAGVRSGRTKAERKGIFDPPVGSTVDLSDAHSVTAISAAYYELVTVGRNVSDANAAAIGMSNDEAIQVTVRTGYRRFVPKPEG